MRDTARFSLRYATSNNNHNVDSSFVDALVWLITTHTINSTIGSWWDKIRKVIKNTKIDHKTIIKFIITDNFDMVLKISQILSRYGKNGNYNTGSSETTSGLSKVDETDAKVLRQYFLTSLRVT